jgi:hypothetical protein
MRPSLKGRSTIAPRYAAFPDSSLPTFGNSSGGQQEAYSLVQGPGAASTVGGSSWREGDRRAGRHRVRRRSGEGNGRAATWTKGDVGCALVGAARHVDFCAQSAPIRGGSDGTGAEAVPATLESDRAGRRRSLRALGSSASRHRAAAALRGRSAGKILRYRHTREE